MVAAVDAQELARHEFTERHMAVDVKLTLYAPSDATANDAAARAFARIAALDRVFSDFDPESETMRLCRDATADRAFCGTGELFGRRQNWGHVGLGIGDGQVVHAWDRVRVDHYLAVPDLVGPPGWAPSRWVGWVPVERVLEGSRPHDWTSVGDAAVAAQRSQSARFVG